MAIQMQTQIQTRGIPGSRQIRPRTVEPNLLRTEYPSSLSSLPQAPQPFWSDEGLTSLGLCWTVGLYCVSFSFSLFPDVEQSLQTQEEELLRSGCAAFFE